MYRKIAHGLVALIAFGTFAVAAKETKVEKMAVEQFNGTTVSFSMSRSAENTTISVSGPNGYYKTVFSEQGVPKLDLWQDDGLTDGVYHYEITSAIGPYMLFKDTIDNGRGENNSVWARKGVTQSGSFRVANGQIKQYKNIREPSVLIRK